MLFALYNSITTTISSWRSQITRHPRRMAAFVGLATCIAAYRVYCRVAPHVERIRAEFKLMKQMLAELEASKIKQIQSPLFQRFEQTNRIAEVTLKQYYSPIRAAILQRFDVDSIRTQLKKHQSTTISDPNQQTLWRQFTTMGIARTLCAWSMYSTTFTAISIHLQIMSRYLYADAQTTNPTNTPSSSESQLLPSSQAQSNQPILPAELIEIVDQSFFALLHFHQNEGFALICADIATQIQAICASLELLDSISFDTFHAIINQVVNTLIQSQILAQAFLPQEVEQTVGYSLLNDKLVPFESHLQQLARDRFIAMFDEMNKIIHTQAFTRLYSDVMKELTDKFLVSFKSAFDSQSTKSIPFTTAAVKFMKLFASTIPEESPETILAELRTSKHIKDFCAIVFFPMDGSGDNIYFQHKRNPPSNSGGMEDRELAAQLFSSTPHSLSGSSVEPAAISLLSS